MNGKNVKWKVIQIQMPKKNEKCIIKAVKETNPVSLTDEVKQQKNEVYCDVFHCCNSFVNYLKLITIQYSLLQLNWVISFIYCSIIQLFSQLFLNFRFTFAFNFLSWVLLLLVQLSTQCQWYLALQVFSMWTKLRESRQITAKFKMIRNA